MNITPQSIYWITRLDNLITVFGIAIGLCSFVTIGWSAFLISEGECFDTKKKRSVIKNIAISASFTFAFILLITLTPSTKQAIAIYVIPKIANNKNIQKLTTETPDKLYEVLDNYLDTKIKDIEKETKDD